MENKPPTATIEAAHREHLTTLPFDDTRDFADADRGFIAALTPCVIKAADGRGGVGQRRLLLPDRRSRRASVHPSLWRQSTLVAKQGLYEVVEGIYQVRGLDLSNISFIEGDTGIIVIDPLVSTETAAAALALYRAHRGDRPVIAVIYTHSHVDHFGGVLGRDHPGRRRRGQGRGAGARGVHRARRPGERLRGHGDGAPRRRTCTARCSTRGPAGPGRLRAGADAVDR